MTQLTTTFEQHDLVWAKIQNYPWWPGKILEIFEQKKSLIFKISFYADPTFCYLREQDLILFQDFEQKLNSNYSIDSHLQKAIDLANNAYQRKRLYLEKRQDSQNKKTVAETPVVDSDSEMIEEQAEKGEQFQQSTIHVDYHTQNSNRKTQTQFQANSVSQLLARYKLDRIPKLQKSRQIDVQNEMEEEIKSQSAQSEDQEKVQLYDSKNTLRRKAGAKKGHRRFIIKRRKASQLTVQQRKVQFMKRFCSLLTSKGFDSSVSRQFTLKIAQKIDLIVLKLTHQQKQKLSLEQLYLKIITMLINKSLNEIYEQRLLQVFNSVQLILYQYSSKDKDDEKTSIPFVHQQPLEVLC